jgi:hypothetical protein
MREHGGNLDLAQQRFGGRAEDWIDLSTGINRLPYPVGEIDVHHWNALPSRSEIDALHQAARHAYRTSAPIVAMGGAQAAIQLLPQLAQRGRARILAPTYNEYAPVLSDAGWEVEEVRELDALAGANLAIVVNPNNPDGRRHAPKDLLALLPRVGRLVIDESFADAVPELSLASEADRPRLTILRSFGKFYGLAGLRLGFAIGNAADIGSRALQSRLAAAPCATMNGPTPRQRGLHGTVFASMRGCSRKAGGSSAARRCFASTRRLTRLPRRRSLRVAKSGPASSPKTRHGCAWGFRAAKANGHASLRY